jgi:hypothetical protein
MSENLFPFKAKLKNTDKEVEVDILQVSHSGLRIDSLKTPLGVNKVFSATFIFPLTNKTAEVTVVVFKSYAEIVDELGQARRTRHLNELVYKNPSRQFNELLISFLANLAHRTKV